MSISSKPELHIALRHDYIFVMNKDLKDTQVQAVSKDLTEQKFNCVIRKDEDGQWLLLVGMNDQDKVLQEAETQVCLAPRVCSDPKRAKILQERKDALKAYLDPRILDAEERKIFDKSKRQEYCGGDYDQILTEAEKSRLIYILFHKIEIGQMKNTLASLTAPEQKPLNDRETMLNFFMRLDLLEELVPLHSKSRVIRAQREGTKPGESNLLRRVKTLSNFFVNVNEIREYYGDETAIYFEWMNYFQSWLLLPAVFAVFVWLGN